MVTGIIGTKPQYFQETRAYGGQNEDFSLFCSFAESYRARKGCTHLNHRRNTSELGAWAVNVVGTTSGTNAMIPCFPIHDP